MGAVDSHHGDGRAARRYGVLALVTLIYALNIADRFILSTLIEPIKAEFALSDSAVGFLTGSALAIFYCTAGLPLGLLADRMSRRTMLAWTLAVWSVFTALCGAAQSAGQLLIARIGVGVGEAGGTPASHSLLADYFPPTQRIVAMSIFSLGIALGMAVGGIGGGMIAQAFGWRWSLILFACAGAPFLLLLALVREPPRGAFDPPRQAGGDRPGLLAALRFVRGNRALLHILLGATIATFAGQGLVWWTPAFLARSHGFSVAEAGVHLGLMNGLGGGAALIGATLITVRLARGGMRGQCRFLAWVTALIALTGAAAYATDARGAALLLLWLFVPFTSVHVGPTLALMQNMAPPDMRGSTVALFLFAANIAGLAVAPQLIGVASDLLAAHMAHPDQSLRATLALSALAGLWSAWHFRAAVRASSPGRPRRRTPIRRSSANRPGSCGRAGATPP